MNEFWSKSQESCHTFCNDELLKLVRSSSSPGGLLVFLEESNFRCEGWVSAESPTSSSASFMERG